MNNIMKSTYFMDGQEKDFNFRTSLTASRICEFVNFVAESIILDSYYSHLKNIVFDYAIVKFMTDVDTIEIDESENEIDAIESFLDSTDIVKTVKDNCVNGFIEKLESVVNDNIEYRTGVHTYSIEKSLEKLIQKIIGQVESVDIDEIMSFAKAFSENANGITSDSIVESYMNSDAYKEIRSDNKE